MKKNKGKKEYSRGKSGVEIAVDIGGDPTSHRMSLMIVENTSTHNMDGGRLP